MENRPNADAGNSGYYKSSFSGSLEKKSRNRRIFSSKDLLEDAKFQVGGANIEVL